MVSNVIHSMWQQAIQNYLTELYQIQDLKSEYASQFCEKSFFSLLRILFANPCSQREGPSKEIWGKVSFLTSFAKLSGEEGGEIEIW